jgi:hypothetical protein
MKKEYEITELQFTLLQLAHTKATRFVATDMLPSLKGETAESITSAGQGLVNSGLLEQAGRNRGEPLAFRISPSGSDLLRSTNADRI